MIKRFLRAILRIFRIRYSHIHSVEGHKRCGELAPREYYMIIRRGDGGAEPGSAFQVYIYYPQ